MTSMDELVSKLKNIERSKLCNASIVYEQSKSFIDAHKEELRKQYSDRWIAVHKDHVIVSNKDLKPLVLEIRETNMPLEEVAVELMSSKEIPISLESTK